MKLNDFFSKRIKFNVLRIKSTYLVSILYSLLFGRVHIIRSSNDDCHFDRKAIKKIIKLQKFCNVIIFLIVQSSIHSFHSSARSFLKRFREILGNLRSFCYGSRFKAQKAKFLLKFS